jgi:hypothetical protein
MKQQYERETSSGHTWKVEKERLEAKIISLETAYQASATIRVQRESQIGSLITQLRTVLENAGAQCNSLQQAHLEHTELNITDVSKISAEFKMKVETRVEEVVEIDGVQSAKSVSRQSNVSNVSLSFVRGSIIADVFGVHRPALMSLEQGNARLHSKSVRQNNR